MHTNTYLYTLRKKLGLTIEEFATLIESNSGILSMAEIGKRKFPLVWLCHPDHRAEGF
jgi:transcriptional regulator with XRE-family HTH domain